MNITVYRYHRFSLSQILTFILLQMILNSYKTTKTRYSYPENRTKNKKDIHSDNSSQNRHR